MIVEMIERIFYERAPMEGRRTLPSVARSCTGLRADRLPMHDRGSGTGGTEHWT